MNRLAPYIALTATLFSALSSVALLFLLRMFGAIDGRIFVALCLLMAFICLVSLAIGHFIATPLHELARKIRYYRKGNIDVAFEGNHALYEADELAQEFQDLLDSSFAQYKDLVRREKQQSQFVGDVAHELRTPLTAIHGNAELLLDPDMPEEMRVRFLQTIISETERLSQLTNDLLSLQHIEGDAYVSDMKRVNLKGVAQEALDALMPVLAERGANVALVGEAPDVLGNKDRLKQVISNLVDNASRFIERGGHIRVELYGVHGNSIIAVKDDGTGFGDVDPSMLFERFYRTDESRCRNTGGSGLGLSIVKSIAEAHDGTVEAYNLPDHGACFLVAIPSIPGEDA